MLKKTLLCHVITPCPAVDHLQVKLERGDKEHILIDYHLAGDLSMILIPEPKPAIETDGLWQHTCFELFIAQTDTPAYYEFNFSPSGQWAAYAFDDYRKLRPWTISQPPVLALNLARNELRLSARITVAELHFEHDKPSFQLGLSAVVESIRGELSYWALLHPRERADFHDRAGFVCSL